MTSSGLLHSPNSPHSSAKSTSSKLSSPPCVTFSSSLSSPPAYLQQLSDARGFLEFSSLSTFQTKLASADDDGSDAAPICRWEGCSQQYSSLQLLVAHLEHDHTLNLQSYVCLWEGCSRQLRPFDARYKLVTHLRCHTGERPYKCNFPDCQRKFSRLENLKLHIRTHTGEKPYECHHDGCKKRFNNTSDRAKHMKTHITRKPYVCKYLGCGKAYTDPSSMRKHIKFVHKLKAVSHGGADMHESRGGDCSLNEEVRLPRLVVDTPMSPVQPIVGPSVFIQHPALSSPSSTNVTTPLLIKTDPDASSSRTIIKISPVPVPVCSSSHTDMSKSPSSTPHFVYSQDNFSPPYSTVQTPNQPLYYVMPVVSQGESVRGENRATDFSADCVTDHGMVSTTREQPTSWHGQGERKGDPDEVCSTEQQIKDKIVYLQHQLLLRQSNKNRHQQQQLPWIPQSSVSSTTSAVINSVQASPTLIMSQPPQMLLIQPSGDASNVRTQSNMTIVPTPISPPRNNLVTMVPRGHLLQPTMQQQPIHHHSTSQPTTMSPPIIQQSSLVQQLPQRIVLPNPHVQVIQGGGDGASGPVPTSPPFMYQQVMLAGQTQPILVPVVPVSQVAPANS